MSTDIRRSKARLSKITQSGGFLGTLLNKIAGPMTKVAVPLANNILTPLRVTSVDAGIQKKIHDSGMTMLIISNKEMNDKRRLLKPLKILTY